MSKHQEGTRDEYDSFDEESHISMMEEPAQPRKQGLREVLTLTFASFGAIYGDLATSPLYVLNSVKYPDPHNVTEDDIYGAVSVIFYLFLFIVFIKYALVVLTFGANNGEGGQVAIYAKIARSLHFGIKGVVIPGSPEKLDLELLKRTETLASFLSNKGGNSWKNRKWVIRAVSFVSLCCCFLGCSLVISDGLLTPTTSVLSAISGINTAKPSFHLVLAVSEVIIIALFFIQLLGSHRISFLFAPIVFLWLIGLTICGCINISHHPAIFKSLSPHFAIRLLKRSGVDAFGGAMLSLTGTEAMFADLGHFGKRPTQIGISCVFIAVFFTYMGQGAYAIKHKDALPNLFFLSIPGGVNSWAYWIMFTLATLSTIIASQALILGVFSILMQLINLDCFPRLRVKHVSAKYIGRVYIPVANFLLLVGVCGTTAGFKNSNNVTAAYGLGISLDFVITSILMIICMVWVLEFPLYIPLIFMLIFIPLEMCLVIANMKKVPHGAWFPLVIAAFFFCFFTFWRYCRDRTANTQLASRVRMADVYPHFKRTPTAEVVDLGGDRAMQNENAVDIASLSLEPAVEEPKEAPGAFLEVATRYGQQKLRVLEGVAIIYSDTPHQDLTSPNSLPAVYSRIITDFAALPSVLVFCTIRVLSIPHVEEGDRILIGSTRIPGHFKCVLRFGYMEKVEVDAALQEKILESYPDVTRIKARDANVKILHIFESNKIRSHAYLEEEHKTRNPFVIGRRYLRFLLIEGLYAPIQLIFQQSDQYVTITNEEEEKNDKVIIGGVMRI